MKNYLLIAINIFITSIASLAQQPGTPDASYGDSGKVITRSKEITTVTAGALQAGNKMIVAGRRNGIFMQRYTAQGILDEAFGQKGSAVFSEGQLNSLQTSAVAIASDQSIIIAGDARATIRSNKNFLLARSTPNGSLDSLFGKNGFLLDSSNKTDNDYAKAVAIQENNSIVVVGYRSISFSTYFLVKRYFKNGDLDKSFGNGGEVVTSFTDKDIATSVVCQPDGKIVVGGVIDDYSLADDKFGIVRYMPDGSLDETFGNSGKVTTDLNKNGEILNALALQEDGKLIATGADNNNLNVYSNMVAVRYNIDGSIDKTFGTKGQVEISFEKLNGETKSIQIQKNQKIVLAGNTFSYSKSVNDFVVARLLPDGLIDSAFGDQGKTISDFGGDESCFASGLQTDGNIVLAGTQYPGNDFDNIILSRFYGDPVKQLSPIAKKIRRWIRNHTLQWQSVNDNDVSYYSIQQSSNGINGFQEIARIASIKNQPSNIYSYNINRISATSQPSSNFYRVTAVSNDGDNILSDVITDETALTVIVAPNPVKDVLKISGLPANVKSTIKIINRNGNVLQTATAQNPTYNMNVSHLNNGVYSLTVTTNKETQSVKFIKQ